MRTTITINDTLFKNLKVRAAQTGESISSLVEEAVTYQLLEDTSDIEVAQQRAAEPALKFDDLLKQFKTEGLI